MYKNYAFYRCVLIKSQHMFVRINLGSAEKKKQNSSKTSVNSREELIIWLTWQGWQNFTVG